MKQRISRGRTALIMKHPFFGIIITRMMVVERNDLPTMAVDGRHLFFNHAFVESLTDKNLLFAIAHEVVHLVLDHIGRRGDRNPRGWNIAIDYATNIMVKDQGIGTISENWLYDEKYRDMTAEEIYPLIMEKAEDELEQLAQRLTDEHIEGGDAKDALSAEERRKIKDEIKEAILSAAAGCQPGDVPGFVKKLIHEWNNPQVDWKSVVRASIEGMFKSDKSLARPNKKYQQHGIAFPGIMKSPGVCLDICIDTSGSVFSQAPIFLSEVSGIMASFKDYKVRVSCWDTSVHSVSEFDPFSLDELAAYEVVGNGGTDVECVLEYIDTNHYPADTTIILTDGELAGYRTSFHNTVIWVVIDNPNFVPNFGSVVHISSSV